MTRGHEKAHDRSQGKAPSQRQLRVGEELRHVLADALERGEMRDPALAGRTVTVTEVRISPDLKNATAFVVPLGGGDPSEVVDALNRGAGFLRGWVAKRVRLRHVPKIGFLADQSFDEAARIDRALRDPRVVADLRHDDDED